MKNNSPPLLSTCEPMAVNRSKASNECLTDFTARIFPSPGQQERVFPPQFDFFHSFRGARRFLPRACEVE